MEYRPDNPEWVNLLERIEATGYNTPWDELFGLFIQLMNTPRRLKANGTPNTGTRTHTIWVSLNRNNKKQCLEEIVKSEIVLERLISLVDCFPRSLVFLERWGLMLQKKNFYTDINRMAKGIHIARVSMHPADEELPCTGLCGLDKQKLEWKAGRKGYWSAAPRD